MLGKLMKYEFKATARIYAPLYAALLFMSLISRLLGSQPADTPYTISMVVASMLIGAAFVITFILTLQRFYKNFMGSEGYLMHTLPVSVNKLIWSKLLVATIWSIVCAVAVFLSIALMAMSAGDIQSFFQSLSQSGLAFYDKFAFTVELTALALAAVMCGILLLFTCMALSMLFNKHRVAISFGFFILITTIGQILAAIVIALLPDSGYIHTHLQSELAEMLSAHASLVTGSADTLQGWALYSSLQTHYMLKRKLNLQ